MGKRKQGININLVVIGHADSGKSTITGHLLSELGELSPKKLEQFKRDAEANGQQKYAWIVDNLEVEREKGMSIDITMSRFSTPRVSFTIIDAPGHRDFIKNMITGTSQADVALLVVSAAQGEFEQGIEKHGQTREHALLAYTLGIKKVIVGVNKMDHESVEWSMPRFVHIKELVSDILQRIGFKLQKVPFIPLSGYLGQNLFTKPDGPAKWFSGPTLVSTLDKLHAPKRDEMKALRVPLKDVYHIGGVGTVCVGTVETGTLKKGELLWFAPSSQLAEVRSIEMHHQTRDEAEPGDFVGFHVDLDASSLRRGYVAGDARADPPKTAHSFEAQVIVMEHPGEIRPGYTPVVSCHTAHVACRFSRLWWTCDKRTGQKLVENPKSLQSGQVALVTLEPSRPMVVESYSDYPPLGRFAVRDLKQVVAVGVIQRVTKQENGPNGLAAPSDSDD